MRSFMLSALGAAALLVGFQPLAFGQTPPPAEPAPVALPLAPSLLDTPPPSSGGAPATQTPPLPPRTSSPDAPGAQGLGGGMAGMFNPVVGQLLPSFGYGVTDAFSERVRFQPASLGMVRQDFNLLMPLWQNSTDEVTGTIRVRNESFNTGAILPNTGQAFPAELWAIDFGAGYRHLFENGWIAGGNFTFGSDSDKPFHGIDELSVGVNAFLRVPQGDHNAWLFTIFYSTNSQVDFPIPGVAYQWVPSEQFQAIIGFPFASATYRPTEDLTLNVSYALLTNVQARVNYKVAKWASVFASFDVENESYFRVGREDDKDRFFYYDDRVSTGVKFNFSEKTNLELAGGYLFNRYYFEGQSLSDRNNNRIDIGDGPYLSAKLQIRY